MKYVTVSVDVVVDVNEFDSGDLIDVLEDRGYEVSDNYVPNSELLEQLECIYRKICLKQPYDEELRDYIWNTLGKMV